MSLPSLPLPASAAQQAGLDLVSIVRINEEIKRVVAVSFKINIMALNAIFLAKRAGTAALGFAVLSNELRVFSQDLRTCMTTLTGLIHDCVGEVSRVLKQGRSARLIEAAVNCSPHLSGGAAILARQVDARSERQRSLTALRSRLRRAMEDAFQMVELGGVLAKSAKIEAAYGQSFASPLAQVSGEFDGIVEEIRSSLESLRRSSFFTAR